MKVIVKYWRGTQRVQGEATTYAEAMELASQNQNAYTPKFYDENGDELHDDGQGLCYPDPEIVRTASGAVIENRVYAL